MQRLWSDEHAMQRIPTFGVPTLRDRLPRRHVLVFGWLIQLDLCSEEDSEEVYWRLGRNREVSPLSCKLSACRDAFFRCTRNASLLKGLDRALTVVRDAFLDLGVWQVPGTVSEA